MKDCKFEIPLSLLLFILFYNKLVIVIAGFTLFLFRNAFVTEHYVTKFTAKSVNLLSSPITRSLRFAYPRVKNDEHGVDS